MIFFEVVWRQPVLKCHGITIWYHKCTMVTFLSCFLVWLLAFLFLAFTNRRYYYLDFLTWFFFLFEKKNKQTKKKKKSIVVLLFRHEQCHYHSFSFFSTWESQCCCRLLPWLFTHVQYHGIFPLFFFLFFVLFCSFSVVLPWCFFSFPF